MGKTSKAKADRKPARKPVLILAKDHREMTIRAAMTSRLLRQVTDEVIQAGLKSPTPSTR